MVEAADRLAVPDWILARALRCSQETIAGYRAGGDLPRGATFHCGLVAKFLSVADGLGVLLGGDEDARAWLRRPHGHFGATPLDVMAREWGLDALAAHLSDAVGRGMEDRASTRPAPPENPSVPPEAPSAPAPPTARDDWTWAGMAVAALALGVVAAVSLNVLAGRR